MRHDNLHYHEHNSTYGRFPRTLAQATGDYTPSGRTLTDRLPSPDVADKIIGWGCGIGLIVGFLLLTIYQELP